MKLVRFDNGKYGIRSYWFFGWSFKGLDDEYTWCWRKHILQYCQGTKEQALRAMKDSKVCNFKYKIVKEEDDA